MLITSLERVGMMRVMEGKRENGRNQEYTEGRKETK